MRLLGMFFTICCLYFLGCVQTAHPLFHEKDLVFEEDLLGAWQQGDETWTFERVGEDQQSSATDNAYRLTITEKDSLVAQFQAHFGFVGNVSFLDVFDAKPKDLNLPLHIIHRAHVSDKKLILTLPFDSEWFEKMPEKEKAVLRIEKFGDQKVAMASTEVLQQFLKDHYRDGVSVGANVLTRLE